MFVTTFLNVDLTYQVSNKLLKHGKHIICIKTVFGIFSFVTILVMYIITQGLILEDGLRLFGPATKAIPKSLRH